VPLYDYDCAACGRRFEVIHGLNDAPPEQCPLCGSGPIRKAFAAPAIHFKGSGWAKKERRAASKPKGGSDETADKGSSDTDTSDTGKGDAAKPSASPAAAKGGDAPSSATPSASSSGSSD
jgi:putative FmdB family regulatory protein